ncbi:LacI family DNA-binding transcriptional regulator [Shouchella shacheensis]|uniref:LacI family DNA-binding transcriptional regulator n=1 Tax=Shouchella shacheensis TaxID=1649580 RepID=UPI0007401C2E|nr:LacI family DNA-binding transcriptional regulator [Shouchella shacheensis]
MATIQDIALRSNVSRSTVSRVLNSDKTLSVSVETRDRVLKVARELNYTTVQQRKRQRNAKVNLHARVGVYIALSKEEELGDPYFLSIRKAIERACDEQGLLVTTLFSFANLHERKTNEQLDGFLVIGRIPEELIERVKDTKTPIVCIDYSPNVRKYDSVVLDFEAATNEIIDHLLWGGYKRIGYIGGRQFEHREKKLKDDDPRQLAFQQRMEREGLFCENDIHVDQFTMSHGYELMGAAIEQGDLAEAYFVASDPMAVGALKAISDAGLRVPEDVALVGFDDIEIATFASTPLTTVRVPTKEMGEIGVKLLIERMEGRELPLKIIVPTELVVRESCGVKLKQEREDGQ